MHSNCPPWLENILKYTYLKWLKMHSNCQSCLEKILKYTYLKWLKMHSNRPPNCNNYTGSGRDLKTLLIMKCGKGLLNLRGDNF